MRLSDISVQRPVLAMVIAALIVAFGRFRAHFRADELEPVA